MPINNDYNRSLLLTLLKLSKVTKKQCSFLLNKHENSLDSYDVDLIVLAGFMRILGENITKKYFGKMINLHPSLLPKYPGLDTHKKVLQNVQRLK